MGHLINLELKKQEFKGLETNWLYHIFKGVEIQEWPSDFDKQNI